MEKSDLVVSQSIVIFGGTFDPVHLGHLRLLEQIHGLLPSAKVKVLPNGDPPHREAPQVNAAHRLAMLQLACADLTYVTVDERELHRAGPSYTWLTVQELCSEYPETPIILVLGDDAAKELNTWHQWQALVKAVNILVIARDLEHQSELPKELTQHLREVSSVEALENISGGAFFRLACPLLQISSTYIRENLAKKRSNRFLQPESVIKYIFQHQLYQPKA